MSAAVSVETFIGKVKQILNEDDPQQPSYETLERLSYEMRDFAANPDTGSNDDEPSGNIHTGSQSKPLYQDDSGLILVRARFGPEAMTPIHSHGSWGVIGVYKGHDRYQIWRRLDEGTGDGEARVEMIDERVMGPGDVAILPPPPQDIHAQQGVNGETALEFVLFGANTMVLPRLYFDPEQNHAREVTPGQR